MSSARIIIIGNEFLSGDVRDDNIHYLAGQLTGLGTRVLSISIVPDDDDTIVEAVRLALRDESRVLVTGGIGPTHDDRTRGAVAKALELPLVLHSEAEERLRGGYGTRINAAELAMARLPEGARLMIGPASGIFGFIVDRVYVFPGVPWLLRDIFPAVQAEFESLPDHRLEIVTHHKEGDFADELTLVQEAFPDVAIGSYPVHGPNGWTVRLTFRGPDPVRVAAAVSRTRTFIET
jgi:molybdenum cofactor synthesis domain-containing protein